MVEYRYSFQGYEKEKMARVAGTLMPLSHKTSREVCSFIKGKKIDIAITLLTNVAIAKQPVPFKRYNRDVAHRKGKIAAGRFPKKVSLELIKLLNSVKKNAEAKELKVDNLVLIHCASQKGPNWPKYGRRMGRTRKMTHIELVAGEPKKESKPKPEQKEKKKEVVK